MTRNAAKLALLTLAIAGLMAMPASAAPLHSDNVRLLDKRPEAAGAIGARFSPDGKTMYVTAATGLFVYDVSDPESPDLKGFLALPHFENEDVDVGDGIVVITNDPSFSTVGALYVIDVQRPGQPHAALGHPHPAAGRPAERRRRRQGHQQRPHRQLHQRLPVPVDHGHRGGHRGLRPARPEEPRADGYLRGADAQGASG